MQCTVYQYGWYICFKFFKLISVNMNSVAACNVPVTFVENVSKLLLLPVILISLYCVAYDVHLCNNF
jgi:hypothetical protein